MPSDPQTADRPPWMDAYDDFASGRDEISAELAFAAGWYAAEEEYVGRLLAQSLRDAGLTNG